MPQSHMQSIRRLGRCQAEFSPADYAAARLSGQSVQDIADAIGVTARSIRRSLAIPARKLLSREAYIQYARDGHTPIAIANAHGYSLSELAEVAAPWGLPEWCAVNRRKYPHECRASESHPPVETRWGVARWMQGYYRLSLGHDHEFWNYPGRQRGQAYLLLHRIVAFDAAFRAGDYSHLDYVDAPWSDVYGAYYLASNLIVHHRNGDRADVRPENLQILTAAEHIALSQKSDICPTAGFSGTGVPQVQGAGERATSGTPASVAGLAKALRDIADKVQGG